MVRREGRASMTRSGHSWLRRRFHLQMPHLLRQRVVQVGDQVLLERFERRVIPAIAPLVRVLFDVVELAFGAAVLDPARPQDGLAPPLLETVGLTDGARLRT